MLPWEATNSDLSTRVTIDACQADLQTVRDSLGLDMPAYFAIFGAKGSTADSVLGLAAFQPFPPIPDLDPADIAGMWKDGIDRLCLETLPMQVMKQSEGEAGSSVGQHAYGLINDLHARRGRWNQLLLNSTRHADGEAGMVGGMCVISTNSDDPRLAGVAKSLWTELLESTPTATWTPHALAHAEAKARLERRRFGLGVMAVVAALAVSVWLWLERA